MNKPEKRIKINNAYTLHDQCYNQACDVWEKYHKKEMKDLATLLGEVTRKCYVRKDDLPCKVDLRKIVFEAVNCDSDTLSLKDAWKIADAVHKRLGNK